jgi:hypothetical protein
MGKREQDKTSSPRTVCAVPGVPYSVLCPWLVAFAGGLTSLVVVLFDLIRVISGAAVESEAPDMQTVIPEADLNPVKLRSHSCVYQEGTMMMLGTTVDATLANVSSHRQIFLAALIRLAINVPGPQSSAGRPK